MEIKTISSSGIAFLKKEEGCRLSPYQDSGRVWTIGIGSTYYPDGRKVKKNDPAITLQYANVMLLSSVRFYQIAVYSAARDDLNQQQFDANVILCYNIGIVNYKSSTVLRLININPSDPKIREAFQMWRYADGKPVLLARRKRESNLYFS